MGRCQSATEGRCCRRRRHLLLLHLDLDLDLAQRADVSGTLPLVVDIQLCTEPRYEQYVNRVSLVSRSGLLRFPTKRAMCPYDVTLPWGTSCTAE